MNSAPQPEPLGRVPRQRILLLVVVLVALVLYALNIDTRWSVGRDSALYLGQGRSLVAGKGLSFNGQMRAGWSPGLPLLWAGVIKVFGESYLVGRLIMCCFAMVAIGSGSLLVFRLRGSLPALCTAILLVGNPSLFAHSGRLLTDVPFVALLSVSLLGVRSYLAGSRWAILLAGVSFAIAILFRLVGLVMLPFLMLGILLDGSVSQRIQRRIWGVVALAAITAPVVLAWGLFYVKTYVAGTSGYVHLAREQYLSSASNVLLLSLRNCLAIPRYLVNLFIDQKPPASLSAIICLIMLPGLLRSVRQREMFLVVPVFGYVALLLSLAPWSIYSRYLMPVLPVLAMWLVDGAWAIFSWIARRLPRLASHISPSAATVVLACAIAATGLGRPLYKLARWKFAPIPWQVESEKEQNLYRLAEWVKANTLASDTLMAREESVLHYWTGRRVVSPPKESSEAAAEPQRQVGETAGSADWILVLPGDKDDREREVADFVDRAGPRLKKVAEVSGYRIYGAKGS
jgi:4-amino-4-deoxy-L-arabinose transferase-like glycosyltransferase